MRSKEGQDASMQDPLPALLHIPLRTLCAFASLRRKILAFFQIKRFENLLYLAPQHH